MADAENETHSGDLPVLQPLPPTHFVNDTRALVKSSKNNLIYKHA